MIDLHLHTTISDGRLTPAELVDRVAAAGVRVMAVTDHDTTQATADIRTLTGARGIQAVSGIEVTAVEQGRDIHILGYFLREDDGELADFLTRQRQRRLDRVRDLSARLASLGMPIDVQPILDAGLSRGRSVGRPQIAAAMIRAGYVSTINEAFDQWLAYGRPAFVPREGPSCRDVITAIHRAGGLASIAHPGKTLIDDRIPDLRDAGLDAIEAHHSDHGVVEVERYLAIASELGMLVTGGSDFHGDPHQQREPGGCVLPEAAWMRFEAASRRYA